MNQTEKFRGAINELARRWCNVDDAFNRVQAAALLQQLTHKGEDANTVTAHFCAFAYGFDSLSVKDAKLVADSRLKSCIKGVANALSPECSKDSVMLDLLCRHWADLSEDEKIMVANAAIKVRMNEGD